MSEPASGSEATRGVAGQRRPDEKHFQTPAWLGLDRHSPTSGTGSVPQQGTPTHDDDEKLPPPPSGGPSPAPLRAMSVTDSGHWVGATGGRTAMGLLLVAGVLAAIGTGVLATREQAFETTAVFVVCAVGTVVVWALMAVTRPMVVDLSGSMLTVRHHGSEDVFNLADPYTDVEIRGSLGSPTWALALRREDGSTVVVGSRTVPPAQLHHVVMHHRHKAEQRRTKPRTDVGH